MADKKDPLISQARELESSMAAANQAVKRMAKAMDEATNSAIDKYTDEIRDLVKQTKLLNEADLDSIKSAKGLHSLLNGLIKRTHDIEDGLKAFDKAVDNAKQATDENALALSQARAAAHKELEARLKAAGATIQSGETVQDAAKRVLGATKNLVDKVDEIAKKLEAPTNKLAKSFSDLQKRTIDTIESWGKVGFVADKLWKGFSGLYDVFSKYADKGMLGSFYTMEKVSKQLNMTTQQYFNNVVQVNKELVSRFGGGMKGLEDFTAAVQKAGKDLADDLGNVGYEITSKFMSTMNKAGFGPQSKDAGLQTAYTNNIVRMNKQFKMFQTVFGDTAEEFNNFYDQLYASDSIQRRIIAGDTKSLDVTLKETMARTENLRLLGLSNTQILEMNRKLEAMYDPNKNKQADIAKQNVMAQSYYKTTMNNKDLSPETREAMKKSEAAFKKGLALQAADPTGKAYAEFINSPEGLEMQQTLSKATAEQTNAKVNDALRNAANGGMGISYKNVVQNELRNQSGGAIDNFMTVGDQMNKFKAQTGMDATKRITDAEGKEKVVMNPEFEKWKQNLMAQRTGEKGQPGADLYDSFNKLRDAVQKVTAFLNDDLMSSLKNFGMAIIGLISFLGGVKVLGSLSSLVKGFMGIGGKAGLPGTGGTVAGGAAGAGAAAKGAEAGAAAAKGAGAASKGAGALAKVGGAVAGAGKIAGKVAAPIDVGAGIYDEIANGPKTVDNWDMWDFISPTSYGRLAGTGINKTWELASGGSSSIGTAIYNATHKDDPNLTRSAPYNKAKGTITPAGSTGGWAGSSAPSMPSTPSAPSAPSTSTPQPPPPGSFTDQEDKYAQLRDYIGKYEGAGGNYNVMYGGKTADLENMTINEVMGLQKEMLNSQSGSKVKSSAIGKYQVINATLREAVTALKLDPNTTKFNKATQDKIANYLIDKRGGKAYMSGKMGSGQFMSNLSKEWAALPKDMSGAGSYDGYNGNKSLAKAGDFKNILGGMTTPGWNGQEISIAQGPGSAAPSAASSMVAPGGDMVADATLSETKKQTALLEKLVTAVGDPMTRAQSSSYRIDRQTAINVS